MTAASLEIIVQYPHSLYKQLKALRIRYFCVKGEIDELFKESFLCNTTETGSVQLYYRSHCREPAGKPVARDVTADVRLFQIDDPQLLACRRREPVRIGQTSLLCHTSTTTLTTLDASIRLFYFLLEQFT